MACTTSQIKKDAERHVVEAEAMGQESSLTGAKVAKANSTVPLAPPDKWCCAYQVLSLQDDFVNEKPLLQHYIEGRGHVCMFLPKFHCELNPIEMLWGYAKYRKSLVYYIYRCSFFSGYRNVSNGKFATAKRIVPECLDMCNTLTIRRFFRKAWRYMDAYSCVIVFFVVDTHVYAIQQ